MNGGKTRGGHRVKMDMYKSWREAAEETNLEDTLTVDFQPLEL